MATTSRIHARTLRILRILKALEDRDQVDILADAIEAYAQAQWHDEIEALNGFAEAAEDEDNSDNGDP